MRYEGDELSEFEVQELLGLQPSIPTIKLSPEDQPQDPNDIVNYLARSQVGAGYTPSFSNIPEEVEKGGGKVLPVGIRKTPAGKWEKVGSMQNASRSAASPTTPSPVDEAMKSYVPTGIPAQDELYKVGLQKSALIQMRDNELVKAQEPFLPQMEQYSNAIGVSNRTMESVPPSLQEQYLQKHSVYVQGYNDTLKMRDEAVSRAQNTTEYKVREKEIRDLEVLETSLTAQAQEQRQLKTDALQVKQRLSIQKEEVEKQAMESVSPQSAQQAQLVLGLPDTYSAKRVMAFPDEASTDQNALTVINKRAENSSQPALNTLLANVNSSNPGEWYWQKQAYLNDVSNRDPAGIASAETLASVMENETKGFSNRMKSLLDTNQQYKALDSRIAQLAATSDARRQQEGYDALVKTRDQMRSTLQLDYMQKNVVDKLKQTLLASNEDLLAVPRSLTQAEQPVASAFISVLEDNKYTTLEDAVKGFYMEEYPRLVETGYSGANATQIVQSVLEDYMTKINKRHSSSGVQLTPTDLPIRMTFSIWSGIGFGPAP